MTAKALSARSSAARRTTRSATRCPARFPARALPGGFTIGETVMRKVESKGMLCAADEIGLPDGEDGLLILPPTPRSENPSNELFDSDVLLELEVTPNRPDLLSHYGMARELATLLKTPLRRNGDPVQSKPRPPTNIRIEAPDACPLYTAIRISGVTIKDSPVWLKQRLESIGLRPINNIVDVTNFVLHELGQPLHAFDAAKLTGSIVVRHADGRRNVPRPRRIRARSNHRRPPHLRRIRRGPRPRRRDGRPRQRRHGNHHRHSAGVRLLHPARHPPHLAPHRAFIGFLLPLRARRRSARRSNRLRARRETHPRNRRRHRRSHDPGRRRSPGSHPARRARRQEARPAHGRLDFPNRRRGNPHPPRPHQARRRHLERPVFPRRPPAPHRPRRGNRPRPRPGQRAVAFPRRLRSRPARWTPPTMPTWSCAAASPRSAFTSARRSNSSPTTN